MRQTEQDNPLMFTVTRKWIDLHATPRGGWTRRQLAQLDVSWPPMSGWKTRALGLKITDEQRAIFEGDGRMANGSIFRPWNESDWQ